MIRQATGNDAASIAQIYNHYVLHSTITFEEQVVSEQEMVARIQEIPPTCPMLVWEEDAKLCGYTYAARWKARCAYRYTAEATIYLTDHATGRKIGSQLYAALIEQLKLDDFHSVIGVIALPNTASVALHEKLGFQKAGHFHQVGHKFNRWIDVGYWQLLLEPDKESAR